MITASHQTFSGQIEHLSGHTEFSQTNLLYIINREATEFTKENQMSGQFSVLIISTVIRFMLIISVQSTCHLKLHNYTDPNQTVLEAVYIRHIILYAIYVFQVKNHCH